MCIYSSTKVRPYVYMCIHKDTGHYYIGYREYNVTLNKTSDIDLPEYKTSSKVIRPIFDQFCWVIVAEFFNGDDAYAFEQQLIYENWGDSLLLNRQYRLPNKSAKFKAKKGINKGRKLSHEQRERIRQNNLNRDPSINRKISQSRKGQQLSEESLNKIRKLYEVVLPDGTTQQTNNLTLFCTLHHLSLPAMRDNVAKGKQEHHKGFKIKPIPKS